MDYEKVGLKAGLEIHQQLDTHKLFCKCPSILRNDMPVRRIERVLNPVIGETGKMDEAAFFEKSKKLKFVYEVFDTNCLVELDEEPPHSINEDALRIAVQISLLLNCKIFPLTQIMRKTVVNGSNTSGFQRTVMVGHDGFVETSFGKVAVDFVFLEEDSARPSASSEEDDSENGTVYKLDRLGIPLVEIATGPHMHTPEQIKETALKIGEILRACKVKRGIGTIRQDLNISTKGANRVEIKGFQDPKIMLQTIENEIERQQKILNLAKDMSKTEISEIKDLASIFSNTKCKFIKKALEDKKSVYGMKLKKMKGILGTEIQPGKRVGTDISDYVKPRTGLGGLIHSDENLNKYDFSEDEISLVKKTLSLADEDAFILLVTLEKLAKVAREAIVDRIGLLSKGVPKEVRKTNVDGTTTFLRPMPGSARMYPETDLPLLKISKNFVDEVKKDLPKLASENKSYLKEFGLNDELIKLILKEGKVEDFKVLTHSSDKYNLIAKMLTVFPKEISKKLADEDSLSKVTDLHVLENILEMIDKKIAENDIKTVMQKLAQGKTLEEASEKIDIDLDSEIKKLLKDKPNLSKGAYMGLIMGKFKGQVTGKEVNEILDKELKI